MFKNWFLLASVSCGVGFGSTFLISRNLQQSALAGLGTVPAVAASLTILSRQRRKEIEHQVAKSRLGLDSLREQEKLTRKEIDRQVAESRLSLDDARQQEQLLKDNCRKISAHGQKLQTGCTQLRQEVDRLDAKVLDRQNNLQTTQAQLAQIQAQIQLESAAIHQYSANKQQLKAKIADLQQEISVLSVQKQEQEILFNRLVVDISTKQTNLFKLDAEIIKKQADLAKIAADLVQAATREQSAIDSAQIAQLALSNIKAQIHKNSAIEKHLNVKITALQNQAKILQAEIASYKVDRTQVQQQISVLKKQEGQISTSVNDLNLSVEEQTSSLYDLNLEIWNKQQYKANIDSEITELENSIFLFSSHTTGEIVNIKIADLYRRWQEVSQQVSQLEDKGNKPSIIKPDPVIEPESPIITSEWETHLTNSPYLPVFQHIDRWGSITESEVNNILGSPRIGRQFNREFREYYQYLPFSIRVETSNNSRRYVKEIITIAESQNLLYLPQPEIVDRHIETDRYVYEPENNVIQDSSFDNESQSDDYLTERIIHTYPVCLFCERPPMPGQDRCNNCN
jgi:chromosome segregation ATPase